MSAPALSTAQHLLAGGIAGAIARTVTSPLDVVKTIMQCQRGPVKKYDGIADAFSKIIAERGIMGFWKGNGVAIIRMAPYSAIKFAAFERYKPLFADKHGELNNIRRLLAGSLAGITAVAATYPLDVVKTRVAVQDPNNPKYKGVFSSIMTIAKEEGIGALWSGFNTTIVGVIPYEGGQFMMHEYLDSLWKKYMTRPMHTHEKLLSGCIAGAFAQTISYPVDTVRKAMQTAPPGTYKGMVDCFIQIIKNEGPMGLFKGMTMNLIKVVPFSSLSFYCVGQTKTLFGRYNEYRALREAEKKKQSL